MSDPLYFDPYALTVQSPSIANPDTAEPSEPPFWPRIRHMGRIDLTDAQQESLTAPQVSSLPGYGETPCEEMELTAGTVYDTIHEMLALARTKALMGELDNAQKLLQEAQDQYDTYKPALHNYPLHALEHAFDVIWQTLMIEIEDKRRSNLAHELPDWERQTWKEAQLSADDDCWIRGRNEAKKKARVNEILMFSVEDTRFWKRVMLCILVAVAFLVFRNWPGIRDWDWQ